MEATGTVDDDVARRRIFIIWAGENTRPPAVVVLVRDYSPTNQSIKIGTSSYSQSRSSSLHPLTCPRLHSSHPFTYSILYTVF